MDGLEEAARKVADAWNVADPVPEEHRKAQDALLIGWPMLYTAVSELAAILDDTWEYNVEELILETGERKIVSSNWNDRWAEKESLRKSLEKYELIGIEYGGKRRKEFKVVKRRKPEGYVDA